MPTQLKNQHPAICWHPAFSQRPRMIPVYIVGLDRESGLLFDEGFKPADGRIPLLRNLIEAAMRRRQPLRLQFPNLLASATPSTYQARASKRVKVLRDGLARHVCAVAQAGNRLRSVDAKTPHQPEPRLVP